MLATKLDPLLFAGWRRPDPVSLLDPRGGQHCEAPREVPRRGARRCGQGRGHTCAHCSCTGLRREGKWAYLTLILFCPFRTPATVFLCKSESKHVCWISNPTETCLTSTPMTRSPGRASRRCFTSTVCRSAPGRRQDWRCSYSLLENYRVVLQDSTLKYNWLRHPTGCVVWSLTIFG